MKVICDRAALLEAVNMVSGVVPGRTPRHQLTCIKITARASDPASGAGSLTLSGTDGEISMRMSTAQVEVQKEGEALIPADKLKQIVAAEDNEPTLTLEAEGDLCHITGRDAHFKVYGSPVADFPPIPDFPKEGQADFLTINAATLATLIERTVFSTARENSRYAINGVLIKKDGKKLELAATDGRRLAVARASATEASGESNSCIVPTKALNMVARLLSGAGETVRVASTDTQIIFAFDDADEEGGGTVLASNLVEGTFPPYEDVIPRDQDKKATFDVDALNSAVRRAALLTNEESRGVRLSFSAGDSTLRLSSRAPEMGEAEINVAIAKYEGDDVEIGFNPAFIVDALKVMPNDQVVIELKAANKPGLIKSGSEFTYVVMPVNLQ